MSVDDDRIEFVLFPLKSLQDIADRLEKYESGYGCSAYSPGYTEIWSIDDNSLIRTTTYDRGYEKYDSVDSKLFFKVVKLDQQCYNCSKFMSKNCKYYVAGEDNEYGDDETWEEPTPMWCPWWSKE